MEPGISGANFIMVTKQQSHIVKAVPLLSLSASIERPGILALFDTIKTLNVPKEEILFTLLLLLVKQAAILSAGDEPPCGV